MLWSKRTLLVALTLAVGACGFAPAYGPQGGGTRLQGALALSAPETAMDYQVNRRLEERLGRGSRWALGLSVDITETALGITSTGDTTRYRKTGRLRFVLRDPATDAVLYEGETSGFTSYSTTGSTVATVAAETDAQERLAILLADQAIDALLLADLPQ